MERFIVFLYSHKTIRTTEDQNIAWIRRPAAIRVLMVFYDLDEEDARELLGELRDKRSLQKLAAYRTGLARGDDTTPLEKF